MAGAENRAIDDVTPCRDPVAAFQLDCPCARSQILVVIALFANGGQRRVRIANGGQRCLRALYRMVGDQLHCLHVGVSGHAVGYLAEMPQCQCAVLRAQVAGGLK